MQPHKKSSEIVAANQTPPKSNSINYSWMPAAIVIVNQQQQQQQHEQQYKQICNINLCGANGNDDDVDVTAQHCHNLSQAAAGVDVKATTTKTRRSHQRTTRAVIIIMALVFSIIQQQQQQQQLRWPFYNGLLTAAAAASAPTTRQPEDLNVDDAPTVPTSLSAAQTPPQTETTNHTFKSLAFLASSNSASDGFAVAETDLAAQTLPIFDFGMPRNITGRTGHTEAIIKCRVDSLLDKSVSWIRKRDLHILTVGTATYTSDKRFQVTESKDAREWTLHVKAPLARDSGIYECQVNTEPKMSMAFQLNIIEISPDAKAIISGPHDLHFKAGSAIILNCVVQQPSVKDIGPIYWYRGEHMITPFDADDDQVTTIHTNKKQQAEQKKLSPEDSSLNEILSVDLQKDFATRIAMESQLGDTLKSRLRISNAQTTDTGNYTCQPTTARSASVLVHVINDENPAAMQKSAGFALFGLGLKLRLSLLVFLWTP